jgi:hypothetical protein
MCDLIGSQSLNLSIRMRLAGTDATGANYQRQGLTGDTSTASAAQSTNQTSALCAIVGTARCNFKMDLFAPAIARPTTGSCFNGENASSTAIALRLFSFGHDVSTAYDSATFTASAGTMTGTYSVFGYNK